MKILLTNDDGVESPLLARLAQAVVDAGHEAVVVAPKGQRSGVGHAFTYLEPLHARQTRNAPWICWEVDGTPADCVKMGLEYFCPRQPDLVLSGINYGSNASINIIYSGTIGAVLEACLNGCQAIGFSLLNHNPAADFDACTPTIRHILNHVIQHPLPDFTALNVNIPRLPADQIKGIRVCQQARAAWKDSLEKRTDPIGRPYWWLTGKFVCDNPAHDSDEYYLAQGYVTVVPIHPDLTAKHRLETLKSIET